MSEPRWFIDALDARGGIVFAAHRTSLDGTLDTPAFRAAAPDFAREPLASRATGLAATRGGFQWGVFGGEREVSFIEPAHLVEFTRRVYLGQDDDDPPGPEDPGPHPFGPPLQDEPPDGERPDERADDEQAADDDGPESTFRAYGRAFTRAAADAGMIRDRDASVQDALIATALPAPDPQAFLAELDQGRAYRTVVAAGRLLRSELESRPPRFARTAWQQAEIRLARAVDGLDVGARPVPPVESGIEHYSDLANWPAPLSVARDLGLDPRTGSVGTALNRVLSTPQAWATARRETIAVTLFAALYLHSGFTPATPLRLRTFAGALRRTITWLAATLPDLVFPTVVESIIIDAHR